MRVSPANATCWETSTPTASNATRPCLLTIARSVTLWLELIPRWVSARLITVLPLTFIFPLGFELQRQTLARSVLLMQYVPHLARRQAIRIEVWQDLLRQLLRLPVRVEMWRMWRGLPCRWVFNPITIPISQSKFPIDALANHKLTANRSADHAELSLKPKASGFKTSATQRNAVKEKIQSFNYLNGWRHSEKPQDCFNINILRLIWNTQTHPREKLARYEGNVHKCHWIWSMRRRLSCRFHVTRYDEGWWRNQLQRCW